MHCGQARQQGCAPEGEIGHHEDFKTINGEPEDLYTLPRCLKITEEGPSDEFFGESSSTNEANPTKSGNANKDKDIKAPAIVMKSSLLAGDIMEYAIQFQTYISTLSI